MKKISAKNVLVLGRGISGTGAAYALEKARVKYTLCDETDFDEKFSDKFDTVVLSPAISKNHRVFKRAAKTGAEIISEIELGYRLCEGNVIAVTGTNGKTTTVELIGKMTGARTTGNIGRSFSADAADGYGAYAVETSSFQLENVKNFAPHIAVITNISPDHLDRHGSYAEYIRAKLRIAENQSADDFLVMSADDVDCNLLDGFSPRSDVYYTSVRGKVRGAYMLGDKLYWMGELVCRRDDVKMQGIHNAANALAAIAAARLSGVGYAKIVDVLGEFETDAHRMKLVCSVNGVGFYNDSKGTNIGATQKAMESMPSDFCLIAGGSDKGYEFDGLFLNAPETLRHVFAIGETAEKITAAATRCGFKNISVCESLSDAVWSGYRLGYGAVLLSPATASFDMFDNYARRGEAFEAVAEEIKSVETGR